MTTKEPNAKFSLKEFRADHNHRLHAAGAPQNGAWGKYFVGRPKQRMEEVNNRQRFCGLMDIAWLTMLHEQGLVTTETVDKLRPVLLKQLEEKGWGGEEWIKQQLPDHDEDVASAVNYGRTLQEPMGRMMMREELLYVFDELHQTRAALLDYAGDHLDTIMAGHSHRSHAQPTTVAAYILSVHDQLARGEEQLELAYKHTNRNSGGCGACSGTGWPVDRERITELLGFDETIELTYDCEASMDERLTILFAASSIATTLTRVATDFNNWVSDEWGIFVSEPGWRGVSSFMPQKAHCGSHFERIRICANEVLGQMQTCLFQFKNEPIQDVLPVYSTENQVVQGLAKLEGGLGLLHSVMPHIHPDKARMRSLMREGFSGAPDMAITLIREKGYGGRQAHRIVATMVRMSRDNGVKPYELGAEHLKAAARVSGDPEPDVTDAEVYNSMGLENFFEKHNNLGDPNPVETRRLLDKRRDDFKDSKSRQQARREKIEDAITKLHSDFKREG